MIMTWGKFFRRTLTALLIVAGLMTATVVFAAIQIFDGVGEWHTNDDDNQQIAMARAQQRAERDAQNRAGVYLQTFSRSVNVTLTDDEISAVTNNIIEIVGDVHFDKKIIPLSDTQTTILYTATLKAKIDPEGIYEFLNRDDNDRVSIVRQNNDLRDAVRRNDELTESLTEQYNRATSQSERDRIRKLLNDADRDFLANQRFEEGNKLYYAKDYDGAIKLYNEALRFGDYAAVYNNLGIIYDDLGQYETAVQNYGKAVALNPNLAEAYYNRGIAYQNLMQHELAIQDYDKFIELNPNSAEAYYNRGFAYTFLRQIKKAVKNYSKAIKIDPDYADAYNNRGFSYFELKRYRRALKDCDKAIQLMPNRAEFYDSRGCVYFAMKNYDKALLDGRQVSSASRLRQSQGTRLGNLKQSNLQTKNLSSTSLRGFFIFWRLNLDSPRRRQVQTSTDGA